MGVLERLARPVLEAGSERRLVASMPVEAHPEAHARSEVTHLEATARLLAGIAPWLESGRADGAEEAALRAEMRARAVATIASQVDPDSPDRVNVTRHHQPLVDAAFLALALLRAPIALTAALDPVTRDRVVSALEATRAIQAFFSNWLLFPALIEVTLGELGATRDEARVDYALHQCEQWYLGDGRYSDGPEGRDDLYDSIVIHPFLLEIADRTPEADFWLGAGYRADVLARARRRAEVLERSIAPDGTFPVVGRSLTYRTGVFHLLAQLALRHQLSPRLEPAAVRAALSAVMTRTLDAPETFDDGGWLRIGLAGAQPSLGETYISTGSLYLASAVLLPLGVEPMDPFWAAPATAWTSRRAWAGEDVPADEALPGRRRF